MEEVWKDITDFPNYEVSNLGNVRNKKSNRVLKPRECKRRNHYICYDVGLYNDTRSKGYHKKIHRLVAEAFIDKEDGKNIIDHIDRNPANNRVNNLRWVNHYDNAVNSNTRCDNQLGHKNICIKYNRFIVEITRNKQEVFYGNYETLEEAIKARDDYLVLK